MYSCIKPDHISRTHQGRRNPDFTKHYLTFFISLGLTRDLEHEYYLNDLISSKLLTDQLLTITMAILLVTSNAKVVYQFKKYGLVYGAS